MKFSQSKRDSELGSTSYNPGPGYYDLVHYPEIVDRIEAQFVKKDTASKTSNSNWGVEERFHLSNTKKPKNESPGPGEYIGISQWAKDIKKNPVRATFEAHPRKVLTIPSIPSQGQNYGYQETRDGMLMMIQDPKSKSRQGLGPGSYDVNLESVKDSRAKGFTFSKLTAERVVAPPNSNSNNPELGPGCYHFDIQDKKEEKVDHSEKNHKRQVKKERLFPSTKKAELADEPVKVDPPGPGHYYNAYNYTSFKPKVKDPNFQFFDSKEARFSTLFKASENPGPGYYAVDIMDKKAGGQGFLLEDRFKQQKQDEIPGPGSYNPKSGFQSDRLDENLIQGLILEKPPAFGTSTKRFAQNSESIDQNPGPGHYNLPKSKRAKKKRVVKYLNPSYLNPAEIGRERMSFSATDGDKRKTEMYRFLIEKPKGHRENIEDTMKKEPGPSSSFASKSTRFASTQHKDSVGPGSHNIPNENFRSSTFNREKDIISKSRRSGNSIIGNATGEYIGPGYYDPVPEVTKPFRSAPKIYRDPKQLGKNFLFA